MNTQWTQGNCTKRQKTKAVKGFKRQIKERKWLGLEEELARAGCTAPFTHIGISNSDRERALRGFSGKIE